MKSSIGFPAVRAYCGSLSRSGPTLPLVPAAVSVWHEPHGLFLKTAAPQTAGLGEAVAVLEAAVSQARGVRRAGGVRLALDPAVEGLLGHHDRLRAHDGVPEPAELRADHRIRADLVRRDVELRDLAGDRVLLLPELRHPERVEDVL